MKIKIAPLDQNYLDETLKLIEICFQYKKNFSFKEDFFYLFTDRNLKNNRVLIVDNKIIGHIGICYRNLLKPDGEKLKIALLGGLCLSPDYQGKGLFKDFFQEVLAEIETQVEISLLWSDQAEFYHKFGYFLIAEQIESEFTGKNTESYSKKEFKELDNNEKQLIKKLYNQYIQNKFITIERNEADWDDFFKNNSSKIFLNEKSYFLINKGQDLNNIIHELAINNINNFNYTNPEFKLWYPQLNTNFKHRFQYTAFIRLKNSHATIKFFDFLSNKQMSVKPLEHGEFEIRFDNNLYNATSEELINGVLGPGRVQEFSKFHQYLYICGVDSI